MRRVIIDKAFKLEKILRNRNIIHIYKMKDAPVPATGCYDYRDKQITMYVYNASIFYYDVVFHEIIHLLEDEFIDEIKDIREQTLDILMEKLYPYRYYEHRNLWYAFTLAEKKEDIPNRKLRYIEFFPVMIQQLYLRDNWVIFKRLLNKNDRKPLYDYLNFLLDLGLDKYSS